MNIIDFHTHAFPDALAERAIPHLEKEGNVKAVLDGKLSSLLRSMDAAGIDASVVLSIATKPEQFAPILAWSRKIASARVIPFGSLHPDDPARAERVDEIADAGLKGLKLHPYYQAFDLDEPRLFDVYRRIEARGLILVCHTGFDIAFARVRRADPARILRVLDRFPALKMVTSHLGAWEDWDEVRRHMLGRPIYMELSCSFDYMSADQARELVSTHPPEYLLFGSDSPWEDQGRTLDTLRSIGLDTARESAILSRNAERLLAGVPGATRGGTGIAP